MPNRIGVNLSLDEHHCRAICDEIGDRLRYYLAQEVAEISPNLRRLMDRLSELDQPVQYLSPSIVPSIDAEDTAMDQEVGLERKGHRRCVDDAPLEQAGLKSILEQSRLRLWPHVGCLSPPAG
jgi:superfamily II helicase